MRLWRRASNSRSGHHNWLVGPPRIDRLFFFVFLLVGRLRPSRGGRAIASIAAIRQPSPVRRAAIRYYYTITASPLAAGARAPPAAPPPTAPAFAASPYPRTPAPRQHPPPNLISTPLRQHAPTGG
eukprot:6100726-Pyramimonas_sp.AAC.1